MFDGDEYTYYPWNEGDGYDLELPHTIYECGSGDTGVAPCGPPTVITLTRDEQEKEITVGGNADIFTTDAGVEVFAGYHHAFSTFGIECYKIYEEDSDSVFPAYYVFPVERGEYTIKRDCYDCWQDTESVTVTINPQCTSDDDVSGGGGQVQAKSGFVPGDSNPGTNDTYHDAKTHFIGGCDVGLLGYDGERHEFGFLGKNWTTGDCNETVTSYVHRDLADWYQFEMSKDGTITIEIADKDTFRILHIKLLQLNDDELEVLESWEGPLTIDTDGWVIYSGDKYPATGGDTRAPRSVRLSKGNYYIELNMIVIGSGGCRDRPDDAGAGAYVLSTYVEYDDTDTDADTDDTDTDDDSDGVSDEEEQGPDGNDPTYDGNNDNIPDSEQDNVTSCHTHDGENYITLAVPDSVTLTDAAAIPHTMTNVPTGVEITYGLFATTIEDVGTGGTTTITLHLPDGANPSTYYRVDPTPTDNVYNWREFLYNGEVGAEINGNVITIHLVDGKDGDFLHLLIQDGMIRHKGAPGFPSTPPPGEDTGDGGGDGGGGGGGGGGCFIATTYGSNELP